jgi:hypothetical protein
MHPFLPLLSLVFLAMGDAAAFFLKKYGNDPDVVMHRPSVWALIWICLVLGGGLAFWLRNYRIHFTFYFALASLVWVILLIWV